jgi:hypothetical protein
VLEDERRNPFVDAYMAIIPGATLAKIYIKSISKFFLKKMSVLSSNSRAR